MSAEIYKREKNLDTTLALEGKAADAKSVGDALSNKVDKVEGKGLSTNDFTNELKDKLNGIDEGAESNVQSDWNESDPTSDSFINNKPIVKNMVLIPVPEYTEEDIQALWDSVFV